MVIWDSLYSSIFLFIYFVYQYCINAGVQKKNLFLLLIGANSAMHQSEFLATTCNLLKAREKSSAQSAIAFGFASLWLKKLAREFYGNQKAQQSQSRNYFGQPLENFSNSIGFGRTYPNTGELFPG